ncbi:MAG: adenylate kinase [bacterium]|nr:adenylate kinase [bacterium]
MGAGDKKRRIIFLGPPNSGKGTQAVTVAERLGIPAISTGAMLRAAVASGTQLGKRVEDVMACGQLVDDELMAEVVRERLGHDDAAAGFLLDGYPRTVDQAETLAEILDTIGAAIDDVVLIDAPEEILARRALGRGRVDDREEVVRDRLRVYREKTAPLVEFYETDGSLRRVDGDQTIEEVGRDVVAVLGLAVER